MVHSEYCILRGKLTTGVQVYIVRKRSSYIVPKMIHKNLEGLIEEGKVKATALGDDEIPKKGNRPGDMFLHLPTRIFPLITTVAETIIFPTKYLVTFKDKVVAEFWLHYLRRYTGEKNYTAIYKLVKFGKIKVHNFSLPPDCQNFENVQIDYSTFDCNLDEGNLQYKASEMMKFEIFSRYIAENWLTPRKTLKHCNMLSYKKYQEKQEAIAAFSGLLGDTSYESSDNEQEEEAKIYKYAKRNVVTRIDIKVYMCKLCDKSLIYDVRGIIKHLKRIHRIEAYVCNIDGILCVGYPRFAAHIKSHTFSEKKFHCYSCGLNVRSKSQFIEHVLHHHLQLKRYECPQCSKIFRCKQMFQEHMQSHLLTLKVNVCHVCKKCFYSRSYLKYHQESLLCYSTMALKNMRN